MKKFISRIRNKRLKGNVSLLVILILLASSVITLLSISQIQHLITYWNMTFNYFRAFYLAKAWTELWLTEVYNRENGFEHEILNKPNSDGSIWFKDIITKNFIWHNGEEWAKPYFDMKIKSRYSKITNDIKSEDCKNNLIELKGWEWIVIALFEDDTKNIKNILDPKRWKNIKSFQNRISFDILEWNDITLWWLSYNDDVMSYITVQNTDKLDTFVENLRGNSIFKSSKKQYLTIKNAGNSTVKFCIKKVYNNDDNIPYSHYLIDVQWHYGDMEVWLQSVVKKDIPSWAMNVLWL